MSYWCLISDVFDSSPGTPLPLSPFLTRVLVGSGGHPWLGRGWCSADALEIIQLWISQTPTCAQAGASLGWTWMEIAQSGLGKSPGWRTFALKQTDIPWREKCRGRAGFTLGSAPFFSVTGVFAGLTQKCCMWHWQQLLMDPPGCRRASRCLLHPLMEAGVERPCLDGDLGKGKGQGA